MNPFLEFMYFVSIHDYKRKAQPRRGNIKKNVSKIPSYCICPQKVKKKTQFFLNDDKSLSDLYPVIFADTSCQYLH